MEVKVIEIPSTPPNLGEQVQHAQREQDMKAQTNWALSLELIFPIKEEDVQLRYSGDAEVDFARRAIERVRGALDKLVQESEFSGYFLLSSTPKGPLVRRVVG